MDDFNKLWIGQTISEFGSHITRDALPLIAVITLAAAPEELGLLVAIQSAPVLLLGLFAGVIVDRYPRRPILILTDLMRLAVILSIPIAALTGRLSMTLLYLVAPLMAILGLLFDTAYRAILPALIPRERLVEGNTKLSMTEALSEIGGPALTGVLVQIVTAPFALVFDAISYGLGIVFVSRIRTVESITPRETDSRVWDEIRAGFRQILTTPILRVLILSSAFRAFFGSFIGTLYSFYLLRALGFTPALLGVLISFGGIGALLGAGSAAFLAKRFGTAVTLIGSIAIGSLLNLLIPLAGGQLWIAFVLLACAQVFGDLAWTIYGIHELSLRQAITPDQLLGRVNATAGFLAGGIAPLGALVAGGLAGWIGAQLTLVIAAFGIIAASVWVILFLWRSRLPSAF
ncbi:MAG: MFS transporter [Anaerolineae bacterium]|jgi:MFS family permease|nr:MFS transporter [Anaerolineae bacterium]